MLFRQSSDDISSLIIHVVAGSDSIVVNIAEMALKKAGIPLEVATGPIPYPTDKDTFTPEQNGGFPAMEEDQKPLRE